MIKKSLVVTILLLICWSLFISLNPFSVSQHQWQDNIVSAEKFIYDTESADNLIVGSSLAGRLQMDSLPNFYNLSLGGQSILDGLNILRNKKKLPKNVFIETNFILRGENENFNEIISSPILNELKEQSKVFRTDKQPLAYINKKYVLRFVSVFFHRIIYPIRENINHQLDHQKEVKNSNPGSTIFDKMLALKIEQYSEQTDIEMMDERFQKLESHVRYLQSNGVNVFFFEMPVNPQLVNLKRAKYLRQRVKNEFSNNIFIGMPENLDIYKTSDGVHLTNEESRFYTHYFKNKTNTMTGTE